MRVVLSAYLIYCYTKRLNFIVFSQSMYINAKITAVNVIQA